MSERPRTPDEPTAPAWTRGTLVAEIAGQVTERPDILELALERNRVALLVLVNAIELPDFCLLCGCTSEAACPGGCRWVDAAWCSSCERKVPRLRLRWKIEPAAGTILLPRR